jgi:hypothetical protein
VPEVNDDTFGLTMPERVVNLISLLHCFQVLHIARSTLETGSCAVGDAPTFTLLLTLPPFPTSFTASATLPINPLLEFIRSHYTFYRGSSEWMLPRWAGNGYLSAVATISTSTTMVKVFAYPSKHAITFTKNPTVALAFGGSSTFGAVICASLAQSNALPFDCETTTPWVAVRNSLPKQVPLTAIGSYYGDVLPGSESTTKVLYTASGNFPATATITLSATSPMIWTGTSPVGWQASDDFELFVAKPAIGLTITKAAFAVFISTIITQSELV